MSVYKEYVYKDERPKILSPKNMFKILQKKSPKILNTSEKLLGPYKFHFGFPWPLVLD